MKKIGLYIHIPFCKSKCHYCDFNSYSNKCDLIESYIKAVKTEIKEYNLEQYEIETIYIGGGTPSYINESFIGDIFESINISSAKEITIEVNPRNSRHSKITKILFFGYK